MSGVANTMAVSCWMRSTMGAGVFAGMNQPCQLVEAKPATAASAIVGTSGTVGERLTPVIARARMRPSSISGTAVASGTTATSTSPAISAALICASPRNGTARMSMPAACLSISIVRCNGLPTPLEP